ncbi:glycosyltransferase family 4 protein [Paenibacillus hexagrammi]|uniref:Glycosyltransferase family 4 protein n=1 Tax=Paenibacillus hexagrammi TaxID=2908839 RepID=A0ABY3SFB2_9BACL|nr:glycosyltransferase family 4 protein [Paenibacillus sp. YPD9-1]UJF32113.1 glycosyltransferase family 4 protein [Paenibacillus sp. YPD9-1]
MPSPPKSVAIVTPGVFPVPSGTSSSVEQVVSHTAKPLARKMNVYVLGCLAKSFPASEEVDGVKYIRVRYEKPYAYLERISKRIGQLRPSIVQVENRPRYVKYLRRKHPRLKISLVLHSTSFVSKPHISKQELSACLRAANVIIVNSDFLKQNLQRAVPGAAHKIVTQHLGVDPGRFLSKWSREGEENRARLLRELGYENPKIILFVGRLIPKKGVHHLLEAMMQIVQAEPNSILLIVGSAYYGTDRLTAYVRKLHEMGSTMPQYVRFIPYVAHEDIPDYYQMADVVVVPSAPNEAFGLVNVEAMASGVPVVATRSGGIQEVVAHGTTGYLVDLPRIAEELPSYLLRILGDRELQRAMGEQGIQRVRQLFTWERCAENRLELYRSLDRRKGNR